MVRRVKDLYVDQEAKGDEWQENEALCHMVCLAAWVESARAKHNFRGCKHDKLRDQAHYEARPEEDSLLSQTKNL